MFPLFFILLAPVTALTALGFGGYLALRAVRALERKGGSAMEVLDLRERLELLEQQFDAQGEELRRLSEGQRFTEKLIGERSDTHIDTK